MESGAPWHPSSPSTPVRMNSQDVWMKQSIGLASRWLGRPRGGGVMFMVIYLPKTMEIIGMDMYIYIYRPSRNGPLYSICFSGSVIIWVWLKIGYHKIQWVINHFSAGEVSFYDIYFIAAFVTDVLKNRDGSQFVLTRTGDFSHQEGDFAINDNLGNCSGAQPASNSGNGWCFSISYVSRKSIGRNDCHIWKDSEIMWDIWMAYAHVRRKFEVILTSELRWIMSSGSSQ